MMNDLLPGLLAEVSREQRRTDAANPPTGTTNNSTDEVAVELTPTRTRANRVRRRSSGGSSGGEAGEAVGCLPLPFSSGGGCGGVTRTTTSDQQQQQQQQQQLLPPRTRMQRYLDEVSAAAEEMEWLRGELEAVEALHNRHGGVEEEGEIQKTKTKEKPKPRENNPHTLPLRIVASTFHSTRPFSGKRERISRV
jgi:hypothetical protein